LPDYRDVVGLTCAEYLIKQYLQTSKQEPIYLEMWNQALAGVRKHLLTYSAPSHFTVLAERPDGLTKNLSPKMDHLVCFMPGTIALGATGGLTEAGARKSSSWGKKQEEEMRLARELTKTCWGMYKVMATGLAPEISYFNVHDPPKMEADGVKASAEMSNAEDAEWKSDYIIKPMDSHNLQRPETVESLFYMWRSTGDNIYREWGWEMFKSFIRYSAVENGTGFTSLSNANQLPPIPKDNMESFWLVSARDLVYERDVCKHSLTCARPKPSSTSTFYSLPMIYYLWIRLSSILKRTYSHALSLVSSSPLAGSGSRETQKDILSRK